MSVKKKRYLMYGAIFFAGVLFVFYLRYIFQQGIYYGDYFLTKISSEPLAFQGQVGENLFTVTSKDISDGKEVTLKNGNATGVYEVVVADSQYVLRHDGKEEDFEIYPYENSEIIITNGMPNAFPSMERFVYDVAVYSGDMRGEPVWLIPFIFTVIVLLVDIRWPDFFFYISHALEVQDPQPTDFYRIGQKFGRVIIVVIALGLLIKGMTRS